MMNDRSGGFMILRPVDENGDMLPVLSSARMLKGAEAVARLIRCRLSLYTGEWWENPARGNGILEMLRDARLTEADGQAVSSYLSAYIRETPGVLDVRDAVCSMTDRRFHYSCTVDTDSGSVSISFTM